MNKELYQCQVSLRNPNGQVGTFLTHVIASTHEEAADLAKQRAVDNGFVGYVIGVWACPWERDILEAIAEQVLGWKRP